MPPRPVAKGANMYTYHLRDREELLEEIRQLTLKRKKLDKDYQLAVEEIQADLSIMKAEIELLKTLGQIV